MKMKLEAFDEIEVKIKILNEKKMIQFKTEI